MPGPAADALRAMLNAGERALEQVGAHLAGEAQRQAPIREGTLRGSAAWKVRSTGPLSRAVEVTFSTPYAARQHEETDWQHPRGGKAKYLSDPLEANARRYERVVGEAMRQALT